jgi:phospholipid/cholesterol/gamma-HCH transport system substrate-binding protein
MPRRRARDLSVGAFVALGLIVLAIGIMAIGGESRIFAPKAHYRVVFPSTEGLRVGSPVMMAGVTVGTVAEIRLPRDPHAKGIEVVVGVDRNYAARVREGSESALRYLAWLSGEKYVEISPGDPGRAQLSEGALIPSRAETEIFERGADIAENLNEITVALRDILGPLQRGEGVFGQLLKNPEFGKEGIAHAEAALENIEAITARIRRGEGLGGRLIADPELASRARDLSRSLAGLSRMIESVERGEGTLGALLEKGGAGERAIEDLREASASLRRVAGRLESKEGLLGRLLNDREYSEEAAAQFRATLKDLSEIAAKINRGEGTLGALVNERALYESAEEFMTGVNDSKFARWLWRHYQKRGIRKGGGEGAPGRPSPDPESDPPHP